MGKMIIECFLTLNGVTDKPWEWIGDFYSFEQKKHSIETLKKVDFFLIGRKTYEVFSSKWINIQGDEYFDRINVLPKIVASRTLKKAAWNAEIINTDVQAHLKALKDSGKIILSYGFGKLQETLLNAGVVDELRFSVIPITVKAATHFADNMEMPEVRFKLADSFAFTNGVQSLTYHPLKR
jgi:dihydrofolate reductase